jgi:septal ring factor EnvC (AmiA/AmiB activator)
MVRLDDGPRRRSDDDLMTVRESMTQTLLVGVLCVVTGAVGDWLLRGRDIVQRSDLQPIQSQLNSISVEQANSADQIQQLKDQVTALTEDLKLAHLHP